MVVPRRSVFSVTIALLSLLTASGTRGATGDAATNAYLDEKFEQSDTLPGGWTTEGVVAVVDSDPFAGSRSLELSRTEEQFADATSVTSTPLEVRPGPVEFSGALKSALNSPDNSFHGEVVIQCLDASGTVVDSLRVTRISGAQNWAPLKKTVTIPPGTSTARVHLALNKATGKFWADDIALRPASEAVASDPPIRRVLIETNQLGNLFFPEQPIKFVVTAEFQTDLPKDGATVSAIVRDYWGAEQGEPITLALDREQREDGVIRATGTITLEPAAYEVGRYYDVHFAVESAGLGNKRASSSFAILPEAPAKKFSWREVPFSSRNWDNRVPAYFRLTDRLGIRLVGVWGTWKAEPPYEPAAPQHDLAVELGLGILSRTPIAVIEHRRPGFEAYDETALREGIIGYLKTFYPKTGLVMSLGNEPRPSGPTLDTNIAAYQTVYNAIKKAAPETYVIGTAVGPEEEYFAKGFQKFSDAVDFHTYGDSKVLLEIFARYRELFKKYGGEQPIWSTELGLNSQGLPRRLVAGELIKKLSWFFGLGGDNASWFGMCYPDVKGKLTGASDDSHNVFNGLWGNYSPRLDAIAYYNMVNGICIKKITTHQVYENDLHAFLFLDKEGENLQTLWKERGSADVFIPIPAEAKEVKLTRIDGSIRRLATAGQGITLRVDEDPVLLEYSGTQKTLPGTLEKGRVSIISLPEKIIRGETAVVQIASHGPPLDQLQVKLPPDWQAEGTADKGTTLKITAPPDTEARYVPLRIIFADPQHGDGDLTAIVPVEGSLTASIAPLPLGDGAPTVELTVSNAGETRETVDWKLELTKEIPLKEGSYSLESSRLPQAYFAEAAEGTRTVEAKSALKLRVPLAQMDPHHAYRIRATVTDDAGRETTHERYVAGFVGVPKTSSPPKLDGKLDESDWQKAGKVILDQKNQVRLLTRGDWQGSPWQGPQDLSAVVRFLWDDKNLYLGVEVTDDIFRNEMSGSGVWAGDGLQLLIDPARNSREKPGKYDYAIARGKEGPVAWGYLSADGRAPAGEAPDIVLGSQLASEGGNMIYEVAIPWNRVAPFEAKPGANLGMAVILNEDDGPKRDSFLTWFGDIQTKEVDAVGDLILTE